MRSWCCILSIVFSQIRRIFSVWQGSGHYLDTWNWRMAGGIYNDAIYLIGGSNDKKGVIKYEWTTQTFISASGVNQLDTEMYAYAQAWTQQQHLLYMIVPETDDTLNQLAIYNMQTDEFVPNFSQIPISVRKAEACLASYNQQLYVLGGFNSVSFELTQVQILNLLTLQWAIDAPHMNTPRSRLSCIVANNYLWAFGGYTVTNERIQISNIMQKSWNFVGELSNAIGGLRCVSWGDVIYIIGGFENNNYYDTVYVMETQTGSILSIDHLPYISFESTPIIVNAELHLFGGLDDGTHSCVCLEWIYFKLASSNPTRNPSLLPTNVPTTLPSTPPTTLPSTSPSGTPTGYPSIHPSNMPTVIPTVIPTAIPTAIPTEIPTVIPTVIPTSVPTTDPTTLLTTRELTATYRSTVSQLDAPPAKSIDSVLLWLLILIGALCIVIICVLALWRESHLQQLIKHEQAQAPQVQQVTHVNIISDDTTTRRNTGEHNVNTTTRRNTVEWLTQAVLVEDWLKEIGFSQYYDVFISNGYDSMPIVKEIMGRSELKGMGITVRKHQQSIFIEIKKLKAGDNELNEEMLDVGEIAGDILNSEGRVNNDLVYKDSEGQRHGTHTQSKQTSYANKHTQSKQTMFITVREERHHTNGTDDDNRLIGDDEFVIGDVQELDEPQNAPQWDTSAYIQ
eukprot:628861_1